MRSALDQDRGLVLLAAADPVSDADAALAAASTLPSIKASLMTAIARESPELSTTARPRTSYRRSWQVRGLVAAAVVVLAIGVEQVATRPQGAAAAPAQAVPLPFGHGTHAEAVTFLEHASAAVLATPVAGSGPVRYVKLQQYAPQTSVGHHKVTTTVGTTITQVWYAPDGSTQVIEENQEQDLLGGDVGGPSTATINHTGAAHWPDLAKGFPTTVAAARKSLIDAQPGEDFDADATLSIEMQALEALLASGTTSPTQTAAVYGVLVTTPGTYDAGIVTDRLGRVGHAVGVPLPDASDPGNLATIYVIINPSTGTVLQTELDAQRPPSALKLPDKPYVGEYDIINATRRVAAKGDQ
jgi:hypothetical protein